MEIHDLVYDMFLPKTIEQKSHQTSDSNHQTTGNIEEENAIHKARLWKMLQ